MNTIAQPPMLCKQWISQKITQQIAQCTIDSIDVIMKYVLLHHGNPAPATAMRCNWGNCLELTRNYNPNGERQEELPRGQKTLNSVNTTCPNNEMKTKSQMTTTNNCHSIEQLVTRHEVKRSLKCKRTEGMQQLLQCNQMVAPVGIPVCAILYFDGARRLLPRTLNGH